VKELNLSKYVFGKTDTVVGFSGMELKKKGSSRKFEMSLREAMHYVQIIIVLY
jgi:hypothetical protein